MATRNRVRFKAEDIFDAPDDGLRYEVIDGELHVTTAPDWQHQRGLGMLFGYLWQHVRANRLGEIVQAPVGVILGGGLGVQPDLVYVSRERSGIITRRGVYGVPDLVVEVLSPGTESTDRGLKFRAYAASGIPHYWMLAPATSTLEAYRLGPEGYLLVGSYGPGDRFEPELFPGLTIPIDDLWG